MKTLEHLLIYLYAVSVSVSGTLYKRLDVRSASNLQAHNATSIIHCGAICNSNDQCSAFQFKNDTFECNLKLNVAFCPYGTQAGSKGGQVHVDLTWPYENIQHFFVVDDVGKMIDISLGKA